MQLSLSLSVSLSLSPLSLLSPSSPSFPPLSSLPLSLSLLPLSSFPLSLFPSLPPPPTSLLPLPLSLLSLPVPIKALALTNMKKHEDIYFLESNPLSTLQYLLPSPPSSELTPMARVRRAIQLLIYTLFVALHEEQVGHAD